MPLRPITSGVTGRGESRVGGRSLRIHAGGQASERACAQTSHVLAGAASRVLALRWRCDANPLRHRPSRSANALFVEQDHYGMVSEREHVMHLLSLNSGRAKPRTCGISFFHIERKTAQQKRPAIGAHCAESSGAEALAQNSPRFLSGAPLHSETSTECCALAKHGSGRIAIWHWHLTNGIRRSRRPRR